jgi:methionine synthase II (cobalamin-independent)
MKMPASSTTGIGSLPHHNIDSALNFSLRHGIPFLPQIPIRNPWEYMIAQALENLPGLQIERDGEVMLNMNVWSSRTAALDARLNQAFRSGPEAKNAFEGFEPSPATSSSWQAFLWELQEARQAVGKIQIAGPMTSQWALRLSDGTSLEKHPDLTSQIFKLVLARSLAMTRRMQASNIQPVLFLDEPGLYAFSPINPKHMIAFQELKLMVQALRKEHVIVGLHCCSNADWKSILTMDLNYLSIDTSLSLDSLLTGACEPLIEYLNRGGRLSLGVIPTKHESVPPKNLMNDLRARLVQGLRDEKLAEKVLSEALYTPACGLALQSIPDAEAISESLHDFFVLIKKG